MITPEAVEYTKRQFAGGMPIASIQAILRHNGWGEEDLDDLAKQVSAVSVPKATPNTTPSIVKPSPVVDPALQNKPPSNKKPIALAIGEIVLVGVIVFGIAFFAIVSMSKEGTKSKSSPGSAASSGGGLFSDDLLQQARDSNRIADLSTLKNSVALYLADGGT